MIYTVPLKTTTQQRTPTIH